MDKETEREELVKSILSKPSQPTIEDAVTIIRLEPIESAQRLLEIHEELRHLWWEKRDSTFW